MAEEKETKKVATKKAAAPKAEKTAAKTTKAKAAVAETENAKEVKPAKASLTKAKKAEKAVEKPTSVKEEKVEAKPEVKEAKPQVTEATAKTGPISVTPRKARLVIDLIRGKTLDQAYSILANTNKAAVEPVYKLICSAEANAVNNFGMDASLLYVAEIHADDSFRLKRFEPRAKGSASPIIKRWSTITVVLKEKKGATK